MNVITQPITLSIDNLDSMGVKCNGRSYKHGPLLLDSIRCIVCGPSNCGKTNVMINLLKDKNGLRFENVYVYAKTLQQPKYQLLEKLIGMVDGMCYFGFSNNTGIVKPAEAIPNSVFVFDDVICDGQNVMRDYFSMGRHCKVDSFYLGQSYGKIQKHLIRDNANLLVLFKQDDMNLRHIYNDHVNTDMSFEQFKTLCSSCWLNNHGFLVIDKDSDINSGRYLLGFNSYFVVHPDTHTQKNKLDLLQKCM